MNFLRKSIKYRSSLSWNQESSGNFTKNTLEPSKSKQLSSWSGKTENRKITTIFRQRGRRHYKDSVDQSKPWGNFGCGEERMESEFPWRTRSAMRSARRWRGSVDDEEVCRKGCSGWKMTEGVVSVVIRGDSGWAIHEGKNCWMSWIMGRDDGAEWVRYTDFSVNPRVFVTVHVFVN
jgi:hypothetical protein